MMVCRRIARTNCGITWFEFLLLLCSGYPFCCARDTLTIETPIRDGVESETLVSAGGKFELGFFSAPLISSAESSGLDRRYVGIWYHNLSPRTVVWVANREKPVVNSTRTGVVAIKEGNLRVLDSSTDESYWSTELQTPKSLTVRLKDSGNLVLFSDGEDDRFSGQNILWQSFQHPSDTFIPGMLMDKSLELTSWRDQDDPGIGNFTFKLNQEGDDQSVISRKSIPYCIMSGKSFFYWKSGEPGDFPTSAEMLPSVTYMLSNFSMKYLPRWKYNYTRLVMNVTGELQFLNYTKQWNLIWSEPKDKCSEFNACGNFGSCNSNNRPWECKCLPGFSPQFVEQWNSGDFSGGCARHSKICEKNDTFLSLKMMKVGKPNLRIEVDNETECRKECLSGCLCQAYSYAAAANFTRRGDSTSPLCWTWITELNNLEEEYGDHGHNISVRIALSDSEDNLQQPAKLPIEEQPRSKVPVSLILIVLAVLTSGIFLACIISVYIWRRKTTKRQDKINRAQLDSERRVQELIDTGEFKEEDEKGIDVPFFDLQSILDATDNFSYANKLGQGGYGPVYKGKFLGDLDIAVKRLSRASGQGLQEFKNEVVLIAKLQHRNLVRLKGYCIKGEEKILLYEYMPNKSLDFFIFDHTKSIFLNWKMRFNIILGITRGLLYLHQDSRLRIIHRDLKTSNILLDEEMNPKISDFGLARIVGGKETESNTNTVVGTYGYMSPEYALDGTFSVKSDAYSFGVVLLEIISGKKNTGFYQSKQTFSLINYAWRMWTENKALELMDKTLDESCNNDQFIKCVNVGLLCVQEDPVDRPTMSNVLTMLDSEIAISPTPKEPAFLQRRGNSSTASSSTKPETFGEITTTLDEGR